jgi:hypothetical protein
VLTFWPWVAVRTDGEGDGSGEACVVAVVGGEFEVLYSVTGMAGSSATQAASAPRSAVAGTSRVLTLPF